MREWFDNLEQREQLIVGAGAVLAALLFYWLLIWEPMARHAAELRAGMAESRELIAYLQEAEVEARRLGRNRPAAASGRSLLSTVDSSSKKAGLSEYIKRIQPEGQDSVRLWIENAPFEPLANWLLQLQSQHGVILDNGSLDRADRAGAVKARLTLKGNG